MSEPLTPEFIRKAIEYLKSDEYTEKERRRSLAEFEELKDWVSKYEFTQIMIRNDMQDLLL